MSIRSSISNESIKAASCTYNRCTELLRKEFHIQSASAGLGPRDAFEETINVLRAKLARKSRLEGEQTQGDFSSNDVVEFMRRTAVKIGTPKKRRLKRAEFIRLVNGVLQEEGGLRIVRRWHAGAANGRYAWIDGHMPTLLRRHTDVISRSSKHPGELWVGRSGTKG